MTDVRPAPSRMNLQIMKSKRKGAYQGYTLLKKKSDALTAKFRGLLRDIVNVKMNMTTLIDSARYTFARAAWASGAPDFTERVLDLVGQPSITLQLSKESVAGVQLPTLNIHSNPNVDHMGRFGGMVGGQVMVASRQEFGVLIGSLVKLANLQTWFMTLDLEIRMTNRRVNALDNVVIPKLDRGINYITKELDEMEREDFFRLKKIQEKKKQRQKEGENSLEKIEDQRIAIFEEEDDDIVF